MYVRFPRPYALTRGAALTSGWSAFTPVDGEPGVPHSPVTQSQSNVKPVKTGVDVSAAFE